MSNSSQQDRTGVRFLCWNVKGLKNPIKRSRVFTHLKRLNSDVVFLQETHLRNSDHAKLKCPWVADVFHSTFNSKSRGVAILVKRGIQFILDKSITDVNGRYLIVRGALCNTPVLLVNVYAPNFDDANFMQKLFSYIPSLNSHLLTMGGDLSCTIDPVLDRSGMRTSSRSVDF